MIDLTEAKEQMLQLGEVVVTGHRISKPTRQTPAGKNNDWQTPAGKNNDWQTPAGKNNDWQATAA
jgi:hypothetical protein